MTGNSDLRAVLAVEDPPAALICGERAHDCVCAEQPGHDGPHRCGNDQGVWSGTFESDDFHIIHFPIPFEVGR